MQRLIIPAKSVSFCGTHQTLVQGGHDNKIEHEYARVSCGRYKKRLNQQSSTVSGLYRILGVDRLLAEEEQFCPATTLILVDLEGLPRDNTKGPLNMRSSTDSLYQARKRAPPRRKGKNLVVNKSNNKHHKMHRQLANPSGQPAGEHSRDYSRVNSVEKDEKRYAHLESPKRSACLRRMILWR